MTKFILFLCHVVLNSREKGELFSAQTTKGVVVINFKHGLFALFLWHFCGFYPSKRRSLIFSLVLPTQAARCRSVLEFYGGGANIWSRESRYLDRFRRGLFFSELEGWTVYNEAMRPREEHECIESCDELQEKILGLESRLR